MLETMTATLIILRVTKLYSAVGMGGLVHAPLVVVVAALLVRALEGRRVRQRVVDELSVRYERYRTEKAH